MMPSAFASSPSLEPRQVAKNRLSAMAGHWRGAKSLARVLQVAASTGLIKPMHRSTVPPPAPSVLHAVDGPRPRLVLPEEVMCERVPEPDLARLGIRKHPPRGVLRDLQRCRLVCISRGRRLCRR